MTGKRSTITLDADEYLRLLNELINLENRLRSVGLAGFNSGKTRAHQIQDQRASSTVCEVAPWGGQVFQLSRGGA